MTELEKAVAGLPYNPSDKDILARIIKIRKQVKEYNELPPDDFAALDKLKREMLGSCGKNVIIVQPFRVTYGCNVKIGDDVFINNDCNILDGSTVTIGNRVLIAPDVKIYAGFHPTQADQRWATDERGNKYMPSLAKPITIGDDVWVGGNVTILAGVTVGSGSIIGAGAVVTRDIPPKSVAVGNPARVIKTLE